MGDLYLLHIPTGPYQKKKIVAALNFRTCNLLMKVLVEFQHNQTIQKDFKLFLKKKELCISDLIGHAPTMIAYIMDSLKTVLG
jgi:predicted protein tyrosine phosphatase